MEHRRPSSVNSEVSKHVNIDQPDHQVDIEQAKILAVEPRWFERGVKEAIHIRVSKPSLNRDGGRFNLTPVWTNTLTRRARGGQVQHHVVIPSTDHAAIWWSESEQGDSDHRKLFDKLFKYIQSYKVLNEL